VSLLLRFLSISTLALALPPELVAGSYQDEVRRDRPAAYWSFDEAGLDSHLHGGAAIGKGPSGRSYPDFAEGNRALLLQKPGASLRVPDAGPSSAFDFKIGDTATLEAWVQCTALGTGQNVYVIGKGRTGREGQPAHNQNWGLRLRERAGHAHVSFVFRDERDAAASSDEFWHRWTSNAGFPVDAQWHHIAVIYTFGNPDSIRAFLDGEELNGAWDMGGPTRLGPWVDDDEVWLGSAMGGSATSSLRGAIDEAAIYRHAVPAERLKARYRFVPPLPLARIEDLPKGKVRVEIFEHTVLEPDAPPREWTGNDSDAPRDDRGRDASWGDLPAAKTSEWHEPAFALAAAPARFSPRGIRQDRSSPYLVRFAAAIDLPKGQHRVLLRALNGSRLLIDGRPVASTPFLPKKYSDNEAVPDQFALQTDKQTALLPPGHTESVAEIASDGRPQVWVFEAFVGGKNFRPETGTPLVAVAAEGTPFQLLTADGSALPFTEEAWQAYQRGQEERIAQIEARARKNEAEEKYWAQRHAIARDVIAQQPPIAIPPLPAGMPAHNPIDHFIGARLASAKVKPAPLLDDAAFLRRATLDTIGLIPTAQEVAAFLADPRKDKRARAIDRLLADPRWADHWVSYWQDALAENPAILKATLNNTGPFRFLLHDALRDDWPMDRFAAALISMEGSVHHGGAGGFALASQNDLPMAEKAQIVASAFLGMDMRCARCHDAPNHPFDQADLFALSAMLQRSPISVPETSLTKGLSPSSHVTVSLQAGQKIQPAWPFEALPAEPLPGVLRSGEDSREYLAAILTDPRNERFAQVLVNRLWKQWLGWGIVDPVDDWENARPSHRELLAWLGRELIARGYDFKHAARLILNSHAYQRAATGEGSQFAKPDDRLFAAPARRRLTAEQLVDSLFFAAGKEFAAEELNFDRDGRRSIRDFNNLGIPRRAWQFVGLSNERDRPALAKPAAQAITDVLGLFGWRESRPEPRSVRDHDANVIQPAILANGIMGARFTRLSDDSAFTALALQEQPLDALVSQLFLRVLSRQPSQRERAAFTQLLAEGYETRRIAVPTGALPIKPRITRAVSWSNHLHPDATRIIYEAEAHARAGDPPTPRLDAGWRERLEDALWSLMLTPELIYLP
jgi:hypothetical protein